ncbi:carbohydrate kinase family protein [Halobacteriovorax sp. CON-3]|uniref:carbohydrate kinase family protein n=1 Tax=Halobacteriovorax sp. CON-3 TaxID=3157710 RepID=UPI00371370F2
MYTFIGDAGFDDYTSVHERHLGGCSLNVATHFMRNSNSKATLIYPAASDGQVIINHCQKEGIQAVPLFREGKTPVQFIETLESGEKNFTEYKSGVLENFQFTKEELQLIKELEGHIVCPLYSQILPFVDQLIEAKPRAKFIFDFHDAQGFEIEKYLKVAELALFGLTPSHDLEFYLREFVKAHKISVLITRSAGEISFFNKNESISYTPQPVDVVIDSTGAGDAFLGAYLAHKNLEKASHYAKSILSVRGAGTNRDFEDL